MSRNKCAYPGCDNSAYKNTMLHFFRFPKNDEIRSLWLINIGDPKLFFLEKLQLINKRICNEHFNKNDFLRPNKLKINAVPKHFENNTSVSECDNISQSNFPDIRRTYQNVNKSLLGSVEVTSFQNKEPVSSTSHQTPTRSPEDSNLWDHFLQLSPPKDRKKVLSSTSFQNKEPVPSTSYQTPTRLPENSNLWDHFLQLSPPKDRKKVLSSREQKLSEKISAQRKIINKLRVSNMRLRKQIKKLEPVCVVESLIKHLPMPIQTFIKTQCFHKNGAKWTCAELKIAMSLFNKSPENYKNMIKMGFVLPSVSVIHRHRDTLNL